MLDSFIIHDLKNPLSAITGTVGLFLDGLLGDLSEEQKKYLKTIQLSSTLAQNILSDLQYIRDLEEGKLKLNKISFPANELLTKLAWLNGYTERENKTFQIQAPEKIMLNADEELLTRVLENLIYNAIKQTGSGGIIHLNIKTKKDRTLFEILNSGREITKENLTHIFDKDFKIKYPDLRTLAGPGLSLFFCKLAVEAMGSNIYTDTNEKGCGFYFYL